jgi:hypothetical protein
VIEAHILHNHLVKPDDGFLAFLILTALSSGDESRPGEILNAGRNFLEVFESLENPIVGVFCFGISYVRGFQAPVRVQKPSMMIYINQTNEITPSRSLVDREQPRRHQR